MASRIERVSVRRLKTKTRKRIRFFRGKLARAKQEESMQMEDDGYEDAQRRKKPERVSTAAKSSACIAIREFESCIQQAQVRHHCMVFDETHNISLMRNLLARAFDVNCSDTAPVPYETTFQRCNNTMLARLYSYCAVGFYAEVEGQQIDKTDKAVCQYDNIFFP
ncbi:hypothetical protein MRX96_007138 [Rhipicephalus microplus]